MSHSEYERKSFAFRRKLQCIYRVYAAVTFGEYGNEAHKGKNFAPFAQRKPFVSMTIFGVDICGLSATSVNVTDEVVAHYIKNQVQIERARDDDFKVE